MSFNGTLDLLIARSNTDQAVLDGLIYQNQSETVIADPGTDAPSLVSSTTNEWLLVQNTPDSGTGLYIGSYKLNSANACSVIDIVSVSNYTAPTDNIGARAQACGSSGTWSDLAHVNDLENKQVKAFVIRSSTPFTVRLKLTAQWCYTFDFTQNNGNFAPVNSASNGVHDAQGWHPGFDFNFHIRHMVIRRTFSETTITSAA